MELLYTSLVLLAAGTLYEPANKPIIPDLPSAQLELNWADLKLLLEQIQPKSEEAKKIAPPPIPWIINAATFTADAKDMRSVRIEAEYEFYLWAEAWSEIPLFGAEVALESATLDGIPTFPFVKDNQFVLLVNQPGLHLFTAVFYVPITKKDEELSFDFSCVRSSVSRMQLQLGKEEVSVNAATATNISLKDTDSGKIADMIFRGSDRLAVGWRYPKPQPPKESPVVACTTSTLMTVAERLISCTSLMQYDILRSDTRQFQLSLPVEARVTKMDGDQGKWTENKTGSIQNLAITLDKAVSDHYEMILHYEVPIAESATNITLPQLEVLDVSRQSGYLAIATRGPVETTPAETPKGMRAIDTNELPAMLRMEALDPILHAYTVDGSVAPPSLNLRRLKEVEVQVASIEDACFESVITEQGLMLTRASYTMHNNMKKFLQVDLGADVEVWGATVSGREVSPARKDENDIPGRILIPLIKSNEMGRRVNAFTVELYYFQRLPEMTGWTETLSLTAPTTDVVAKYVTWEVLLPESQRVYHTLGDFTWVTHLPPVPHAPSAQVNRYQGTVSFASPGGSTETLRRLQEGMENKLPPKNAPVTVQSAPALPLAATGIQPVQMELPQVGKSHYFERHLVPENTSLKLELRTYNMQIAFLLKMVWRAVALLFGFIAANRLLKHFTLLTQINTAIAVILVTVAARYCGMSFFAFVGWSLLGIILALFLYWRRSLSLVPEEF